MTIDIESQELVDTATVRKAADAVDLIERVHLILRESSDVREVKGVRDRMEVLRQCAKKAQLGTRIQNQIAELKLIAERKAGKLLKSLKLRGGDRRSKSHPATLSLDDMGITKHESSRWQMEASVPDRAFRRFVREATTANRELTSAGLIRLARKLRDGTAPSKAPDFEWEQESRMGPSSCAEEIVEELTNHIELIHGIVKPLCDLETPVSLHVGERRILRRLLLEFRTLLSELRHNVTVLDDGRESVRDTLVLN